MTAAAQRLVALLGDVRGQVLRPFPDDEARRDWSYVPRRGLGPTLDQLDRPARKAVFGLLSATLTYPAFAQAATIMALEDVLDASEGGGLGRHRDGYHLTLYGTPGDGDWGWRFEGHHLSLNLTVVDQRLSATPLFLGANPAAVRADGTSVLRPMVREEELARTLLAALDPAALDRAVVAQEPPRDITTRDAAHVRPPDPVGIAAVDLSGEAAAALDRLARCYLDRLAPDLRPLPEPPPGLHFAWAGAVEPGSPHYYRLTGHGLLVEYDNTQNAANHVHTVLRDPDRDFGHDLLGAHYAEHHA